tara:strand:- start:475 stop:687 length:213 start_codon:yes stop_codon:yes gene_type:complete
MGNKNCCNFCIKNDILLEEEEYKEEIRFGICPFCKKEGICTFNPGNVYGSLPLKMCIECEVDLNRYILDE